MKAKGDACRPDFAFDDVNFYFLKAMCSVLTCMLLLSVCVEPVFGISRTTVSRRTHMYSEQTFKLQFIAFDTYRVVQPGRIQTTVDWDPVHHCTTGCSTRGDPGAHMNTTSENWVILYAGNDARGKEIVSARRRVIRKLGPCFCVLETQHRSILKFPIVLF